MTLFLLAISLADLEKLALSNNAAYKQAEVQVQIAEGQRKQAGLYPNPSIGFNSEHNSPNPAVRWGSNGGVLGQRIVTGGKLGVEKAIADREIDEARAKRDWARLSLSGHLRSLYYQALGEQQLVTVREELLKTATETVEIFRQLQNTGMADEPDVLTATVEMQRAQVRLEQAQQARVRTWKRLSAVVQQELAPQAAEGEFLKLPELTEPYAWQRVTEGSPELVLPEVEIRRAELALRQARKARIPDIQARGGVRYNRELSEFTRGAIGPEGIFDISVELPIFNRQQGNIAAAKAGQAKAALEPDRARRGLEARFAETWREFAQARTAAVRYRAEMLPATEKALALYRANYKAMSGAYPAVLQTQRALFAMQEEYVESLQQAWQAVARLEALLATTAD